MRLGAQLKIPNSKLLTRTASAVRYVRHANIVQRVKTFYKIKNDSRESKSCFNGFLLIKATLDDHQKTQNALIVT